MAILPGSGYLSDDDRTEGEMKVAMELLHDVIAELGSKAPTLITIDGNSITDPLASMILVRSQNHLSAAGDDLDSIDRANITQGRIVILKNNDGTSTESSGQTITVNNGSGEGTITLRDGAASTFILCAERMLALIYIGDHWVEVWRSYGRTNAEDSSAERDNLGLGTASVEAIATGSGASANSTVLKVGPGANIPIGGLLALDLNGNIQTGSITGGNADTLDNHDSSVFVRKNDSNVQNIIGNLISKTSGPTKIIVNTSDIGATTVGFSLQDQDDERAFLHLDTGDGDVYLSTYDSVHNAKAAIRINAASKRLEFNSEVGVDTWESLTPGAGNGLNAANAYTLEGVDLATINGPSHWYSGKKLFHIDPDVPIVNVPITNPNNMHDVVAMACPSSMSILQGKYVKIDYSFFFKYASNRAIRFDVYFKDGGTSGIAHFMGRIVVADDGQQNGRQTALFGSFKMPDAFDWLLIKMGETTSTSGQPFFNWHPNADLASHAAASTNKPEETNHLEILEKSVFLFELIEDGTNAYGEFT